MTQEQMLNNLRIKKGNYYRQNEELRKYPSDEIYSTIYENEIRISELDEIIREIEGE